MQEPADGDALMSTFMSRISAMLAMAVCVDDERALRVERVEQELFMESCCGRTQAPLSVPLRIHTRVA